MTNMQRLLAQSNNNNKSPQQFGCLHLHNISASCCPHLKHMMSITAALQITTHNLHTDGMEWIDIPK